MIKPPPFKYKCPKCGYSKIVRPKSDVINPMEWMSRCPKCKSKMDKVKLNPIEEVFIKLTTFR